MPDWTIEVSPEVEDWYLALRTKGLAQADRALDRLREVGPLLPMPHSRQLGEGLQELRFTCQDHAQPLTYYVDSERRIITLTTFVKQRQNACDHLNWPRLGCCSSRILAPPGR